MNIIRLISIYLFSLVFCLSAFGQSFQDTRNGQSYSYINVNNLFWFTDNLNYEVSGSWCYNDIENNCSKNGRLYTFETANEICPEGWRLPTSDEVIGRDRTGNIWNNKAEKLVTQLSGYRNPKDGGHYKDQGKRLAIWTSYKGNPTMAAGYENVESFECFNVSGGFGLSVRCVAETIPQATTQLGYQQKRNKELYGFLENSKLNKETIPKSYTEYDGVYAIAQGSYYELMQNDMFIHHFVFPYEGYTNRYSFFGKYPRVAYTRTANRTLINEHPTEFILKGFHFSTENVQHISVNPVEIVKLSDSQYFHSGGSQWYDEGYGFLPKWDRESEKYIKLNSKIKKLGPNQFKLKITDLLSPKESYMITCVDKIWIFVGQNDLSIK